MQQEYKVRCGDMAILAIALYRSFLSVYERGIRCKSSLKLHQKRQNTFQIKSTRPHQRLHRHLWYKHLYIFFTFLVISISSI